MVSMTREEALQRLHEIVDGIDEDEGPEPGGWWETSAGAEFGAEKLRLLEELISQLTEG